jgi:hypothetical protein
MESLKNELKELERQEKRYLKLSLQSPSVHERFFYKKKYREVSEKADKIYNQLND